MTLAYSLQTLDSFLSPAIRPVPLSPLSPSVSLSALSEEETKNQLLLENFLHISFFASLLREDSCTSNSLLGFHHPEAHRCIFPAQTGVYYL